ncbi:MAG: Zn-dependent exopeptidase M28 [Halobacteriovoraceae bacterium]|jgi:hypothetical protein|nr:Zn-dependent exopeptidase M28 [Halobacteriovoraceae bacterium]
MQLSWTPVAISFKFTLLLLFFTAPSFGFHVRKFEKVPKRMSNVSSLVGRYKKKVLIKNLRNFVKCCRPNRMVGQPGHKRVVPFLVDSIKSIDTSGKNLLWVEEFDPDVDYAIKLYKKDFKEQIMGKFKPETATYKMWDRFTKSMVTTFEGLRKVKGHNVIWEKKGTEFPDEVLIIGAHYDTIANDKKTLEILPKQVSPGADDNGSGVALAMSLIEVLLELDLKRTVRVIFFDYEELGFLGSRAYVQKNLGRWQKLEEKFKGYVNLEMLGHDTKKSDKKKKAYNMKMYIQGPMTPTYNADLELASSLQKLGNKSQSAAKFKIDPNGFNRSDNISFTGAGLAAVTFSQNWEDDFNKSRYHTQNDFVETLNLKTYHHVFRYITSAIIGWSFALTK